MLPISRRQFLEGLGGAAFLLGCSERGDALDVCDAGASGGCADPFAGGTRIANVPFLGEEGPLETSIGEGLSGRYFTDLSRLTNEATTIENARYYVRTKAPELPPATIPWKISVTGLVPAPTELALSTLAPLVRSPLGPYVMECSGNGAFAAFGMMSAATWSGIPMADVLRLLTPLPNATRVLISGFDEHRGPAGNSMPGASWIFAFDDLRDAFLAIGMNGAELPLDHGAPIRLMVPNWYGCTCIKWVNAIELVDDSAEATAQMKEFASRTHQDGIPALARDYLPATIDQAAMPIRVERWLVRGAVVYRVVGILWGGDRPTDKLMIHFEPSDGTAPIVEPVEICPHQTTNKTWTLWSFAFRPLKPGRYDVRLTIDDPSIRTRRLDRGFYRRTIEV